MSTSTVTEDPKQTFSKEELGIVVNHDYTDNKPNTRAKSFNPKYKLFREFTLASLSVLTEIKMKLFGSVNPKSQVTALDALSITGVCGLQWKKNLGNGVCVTLADPDDVTVMTQNVEANGLTCLNLNPAQTSAAVNYYQVEKDILVRQAEARTIMIMDAFNFIYLNPTKNLTTYFDPAFNSLTSHGLLCFIVPDVSLFARSPHVAKRYLDAQVVKTEYLKELAARIIIANLSRCAARFNKGITVNYVVSNDDNLLVCVQVLKGHAAADASVATVSSLLHCRLCEQRNFIPQQLAPIEDPYGLLCCDCKNKNPGKTAVVLGPMWKGPIFQRNFLNLLYKHGEILKLSAKFFEVTNLLIAECLCSDSISAKMSVLSSQKTCKATCQQTPKVTCQQTPYFTCHKIPEVTCQQTSDVTFQQKLEFTCQQTTEVTCQQTPEITCQQTPDVTHQQTSELTCQQTPDVTCQQTPTGGNQVVPTDAKSLKRKATDSQSPSPCIKLPKTVCNDDVSFYYNISKFRRTNIPKLDKLVTILQCQGHKASRTHFDHSAIRTSANVDQFLKALS